MTLFCAVLNLHTEAMVENHGARPLGWGLVKPVAATHERPARGRWAIAVGAACVLVVLAANAAGSGDGESLPRSLLREAHHHRRAGVPGEPSPASRHALAPTGGHDPRDVAAGSEHTQQLWGSSATRKSELERYIREHTHELSSIEGAVGEHTQQLWGSSATSKSELERYIREHTHELSSIEGQPAIEISTHRPEAVHTFKHDARHEHDRNVFANYDPDAFGSQKGNKGDEAAREWHMISPSSDLAKIEGRQGKSTSDSWSGEESALDALQAKAEARLKKDKLAVQDSGSAAVKGNGSVVVDDAGEHVPADSVAAVASAMGYKSVKAFLAAEGKEETLAKEEAAEDEKKAMRQQVVAASPLHAADC